MQKYYFLYIYIFFISKCGNYCVLVTFSVNFSHVCFLPALIYNYVTWFILYTWDLYCNISKYYKGHAISVDVQIENHAPTYVTVEKFYPVFNMTIIRIEHQINILE